MAGSYNHVVAHDGNLGSNQYVVDMLDTGGDVFEAIEEMYGMIWYLARAMAAENDNAAKIAVEVARKNYKEGLKIAKTIHDQYPDEDPENEDEE